MTGRSETQTQTQEFIITRTFDAPRDLVWQAFAEADQMARWWGPKGCTIGVARFEFRPGGLFVYSMGWPDGGVMWARFAYREIAAPERIVFVNSFSDEAGSIQRAPFFEGRWPLEVLTTVTFSEAGGKTTLHLRAAPIDVTEIEYQAFLGNFESMQGGYGGTFDQLDEHLAQAHANA